MPGDDKERRELLKIFSVPESEQFLEDFGCAILKDIPIHGRMYLTKNYVLFHANIFNFKTTEKLLLASITRIEKANMALLIPNAIAIHTATSKYVFTSFTFRDAAFRFLTLLWRVAMELPKDKKQQGSVTSQKSSVAPGESSKVVPASAPALAKKDEKQRSLSDESEYRSELSPPRSAKMEAHSQSQPQQQQPQSQSQSQSSNPDQQTQQQQQQDGATGSRRGSAEDEDGPEGVEATFRRGMGSPVPVTLGEIQPSTPAGSDKTSKKISAKETPTPFTVDTVEKMKEVVSLALSMTVSEYYTMFLCDNSPWERDFHMLKGDSEMEATLWRESTDGARVRDLMYRTPLNNRIGPKSTRVHEQQVLRQVNSKQIVLETSVWTLDVPYGDAFCVISRFSITDAPEYPGCWVYVSIGTCFTKNVWIKGLIEKGAYAGSKEYFSLWTKTAKDRVERHRSRTPFPVPERRPRPEPTLIPGTGPGDGSLGATIAGQDGDEAADASRASLKSGEMTADAEDEDGPSAAVSDAARAEANSSFAPFSPNKPPARLFEGNEASKALWSKRSSITPYRTPLILSLLMLSLALVAYRLFNVGVSPHGASAPVFSSSSRANMDAIDRFIVAAEAAVAAAKEAKIALEAAAGST